MMQQRKDFVRILWITSVDNLWISGNLQGIT